MAHMTLTQLRYLVAIADSGLNITQAAVRVHATQPGLSKQIKQLEAELGCLLFTRKGKSLDSITPVGRLVLERARLVVEESSNIRSLVSNLRHENRGELHIATTHTQARFVLPPVVAELKRRYKDVLVHISPGGEEQALQSLDTGQTDFAITSTSGRPLVGPLCLPIYRWDRVILVPRNHPLAATRKPLTLKQLAQYPLVSYESSLRSNSSLHQAFSRAGLEPRIAFTAQDADLIKTYVRAGLGVGVLAEMAIQPSDLEDLAVIPGRDLFPVCTTWVVLRRDRLLRDFAFEFIGLFAPQLDTRTLRRLFESKELLSAWPEPPHWDSRLPKSLSAARTRA
jgi:LysR family transcriptional regulator, cys regulon transcriptional activator